MQALEMIRALGVQGEGNDITEAAELLGEHFKRKYVYPIKQSYDERREKCRRDPSPRVNLLKAFLPFASDKVPLEKLIDMLTGAEAINIMLKEYYEKGGEKKLNKNKEFNDSKNEIFYEENMNILPDFLPAVLFLILAAKRL